MANGDLLTNDGLKIVLYRSKTGTGSLSLTQYNVPTKAKVGVVGGTPLTTSTDLTQPVPITSGTINDPCNDAFTGSSGGADSTDNTSVFKQGGNLGDDTAQNMLTNTSSTSKVWTKTVSTAFDPTLYGGFWLYVVDGTTLAKISACEARWQSSAGNYYSKTFTLASGWNWCSTYPDTIEDLTETGTAASLTQFVLVITTNNASDSFVAGDVVLDLVRTFSDTDLLTNFVGGVATLDYALLEATTRVFLGSTMANGFDINQIGHFNEDTTPLLARLTTFNSESKSNLDEFAFVMKEEIE